MLVAVSLWPMCCHTEIPSRRHRTWHPNCHSIQTRGRHVDVLSIDVERHTGIHSYPFQCLGQTRPGNPSPTFHTHQRTLNWFWYGGSKSEAQQKVPCPLGFELGTCGVRLHFTIRSPAAASFEKPVSVWNGLWGSPRINCKSRVLYLGTRFLSNTT